jgi:hypothetical protein
MGKEKISILIVKDIGKVKSYRISLGLFRKIVALAGVLFILTMASVFGFFHLFWGREEMRDEIKRLTEKTESAKKEVKKHKKTLEEIRKQLASLKAKSKQGSGKAPKSRVSSRIDKGSREKSDVKKPLESMVERKKIGIRNFKKVEDRDPMSLKVRFGLFNQDPQNRIVEGRIIMVASKDQPEPSLHISYPSIPLSSGRPVNPKRGYRFAISRFKKIEGNFNRPSYDLYFDKVTIFVYSLNGDLILKEVYEIEDR